MHEAFTCVDINSEACPCVLAENNNCILCSRLQGKTYCDCNWTGICILYERHWQEQQTYQKRLKQEVVIECKAIESITATTYRLRFELPLTFAKQLDRLGSFVFLRRPQDTHMYQFPVGIMTVHENLLEVVVESKGPKSKRLLAEDNRYMAVRGPYYNGILGRPWLENLKNGRVILVAGGIGQAPALAAIKKLLRQQNMVTAILAPGSTGKVFIADELSAAGVLVSPVDSIRRLGLTLLAEKLKQESFDLLVSAGPDQLHRAVIDVLKSSGKNIPMAITNNAVMCCGEGICGSCERELESGEKIRLCKVQCNVRQMGYE